MRGFSYLLGALVLSACGAGTNLNATSQSGSHSIPTVIPDASTGFARASDNVSSIVPGTTFHVSATRVDIVDNALSTNTNTRSDLAVMFNTPTEIVLDVAGKRYNLTYDATKNQYVGQSSSTDVSVFFAKLSDHAGYTVASVNNPGTSTTSGSVYTSILGYTTDPARLPATASYAGRASMNAVPEIGATDTANGTLTMTADFTNGTLAGTINLTDAIGDTTGPVDLGNMSISFDHPYRSSPIAPPTGTSTTPTTTGGLIDGNTFIAALPISTTDLLNAGIYGDPNLRLNGGFYGPTGETAAGISVGMGRTSGTTGTQDVLLSVTVSADKQ